MIREVVPEDNQITVVNIHGFINSCVSACAWNLATPKSSLSFLCLYPPFACVLFALLQFFVSINKQKTFLQIREQRGKRRTILRSFYLCQHRSALWQAIWTGRISSECKVCREIQRAGICSGTIWEGSRKRGQNWFILLVTQVARMEDSLPSLASVCASSTLSNFCTGNVSFLFWETCVTNFTTCDKRNLRMWE